MKPRFLLLAILSARLVFLLPDMFVLLLVGTLGFGVPVRGSLLVLALAILVGGVCFAGIGLLAASRAEKSESVTGLMNLIMLPQWLLSGAFFSSERFPDVVQPFIQALPLTLLINSLRDDKTSAFQRRYRDVDILLIDDIQFLENRERTQEEFFHTFNTLHNANKQIVISSDRSPRQLATLEDRLRTRFEWGLLADIQPPDLETRIAILQKKAAQERLLAPPEVLEFIASRITNSIRELEGALIRVTAFASLNRAVVDLALAEEVLRDFIPDGLSPELTADQIMDVTSEYFGVSMEDLRGQSRSRVLVNARQVAMYLCRELTDLSLPRIGQAFGGRDHTTVMHAVKKVEELCAADAGFSEDVDLLKRMLEG